MARGHHYRPTEAHMGHHAMRADGGSVHSGKHHIVHNGEHDEVHHHHYAEGGPVNPDTKRRIPEEREGEMETYTARPNNEEDEAAGEMRKRGGKAKRARGGSVHKGKHHVVHNGDHENVEHHHHADGGPVKPKKHVDMEGAKTKHRRLDRPGRKRGGGVGSDMTPLSNAARTQQAGSHRADADELAEGG